MKRIICLFLCIILVFSVVSCGEEKSSGEKLKDVKEDSVVPKDLVFEGESFVVLCREDNSFGKYVYEIAADEGATDTVNQAVYQRNRDVIDIFALSELKAHAIPGDWDSKDDFVNTFRNSIDAGLSEFDLIMSQQAYMAVGELNNYFYNFHELPYVSENLDAPYYYEDCVNQMTINGQLKYMVGDYSLTYWDHTFVMFFNKQLAQEHGLENIYELVKSGEWTIDKCIEMAKGKWKDDNNDDWPGVEDTFGYITDTPNVIDALTAQFDIMPTTTAADGTIIIGYDVNKATNILTKMIDFKRTNDMYTAHTTSSDTVDENPLDKIFREGRALFYPANLKRASGFRSMSVDFGIVPYPKWDTNQPDYYTSADVGYSVACVPVDAPDFEKSGAVFEVLSSLSHDTVVPAYYDQALKYKLTRDEDSAEMLDIIRQGFRLNFGVFYAQSLECGSALQDCFANDNTNFASYHQTRLKGYERKLKQLLEYYQ